MLFVTSASVNFSDISSVGVGGAITSKSDEEQEYEECLVKIKPIFEALNHKNEN